MVIKILSKLRKGIKEHTENFNKESENIKIPIMVSSGYMPRSGTAESYGSMIWRVLKHLQPEKIIQNGQVTDFLQEAHCLLLAYKCNSTKSLGNDALMVCLSASSWAECLAETCSSLHLMKEPLCCLFFKKETKEWMFWVVVPCFLQSPEIQSISEH